MRNSIIIAFLLSFFISYNIIAQEQEVNLYRSLSTGEKIEFDINYKLGPAWITAGKLILKCDTLKIDSSIFLKLSSESFTSKNWRWLYNVHSKYESICWPNNYKGIAFEQHTEYGSHLLSHTYQYGDDSIKIITQKDDSNYDTIILNEHDLYDALSAIYYVRTLDYMNMSKGDSLSLNIINGNIKLNQSIKYEGESDLESSNDEIVQCHKFSALIKNNKIINEDEAVEVWVSKEENPVPLLIKAHIRVGIIIISLNNYKSDNEYIHYEDSHRKK